MEPEARDELREKSAGDDVIMLLLQHYAPLWLAGLLGAGIMAAVMASDSQILALSTMFTEDVFAFYGGKTRFGETVQMQTGRIFIILITLFAYAVALRAPETIFELAIQYAFSGFAALSPLLVAALFWRGSTKWGALAVDSLDCVWRLLPWRSCRQWFRRLRLDQRRSSGRLEVSRPYRELRAALRSLVSCPLCRWY